MRALLGVVVLLVVGCVDLKEPRAFRCERDDGCSGGWVCLKDHYCHDPEVGAEVACVTTADCTSDWFCGQELRCLDPKVPSALPCDDDLQCAPPWRCSSERRCVSLADDSAALPFTPSLAPPTRHSPLTAPADLLRTSPVVHPFGIGAPLFAFQAALVRGRTLEFAMLGAWPTGMWLGVQAERSSLELAEAPLDLAISTGVALLRPPTGPLQLLSNGGMLDVTLPFAAEIERLVPLAWNQDDGVARGGFVIISRTGKAAFLDESGAVALFAPGVIDVAGTGGATDAGLPVLVVLRQVPGGEALLFGVPGVPGEQLVLDLSKTAGGSGPQRSAARVRFESDSIGLTFRQGAGFRATVVCPGLDCDGGVPEGFECPSTPTESPDFAVPAATTVRVACSEPGDQVDFLYDYASPGLGDFVGARAAHRSWGTSKGHVRQSFGGQLSWSGSLDEEVTDVLTVRPDALGVHGGDLVATSGQDLYTKPALAAPTPAGALGLSLSARILPGVGVRPVGWVEGQELTLLENGVVTGSDGTNVTYPFILPVDPSPGSIARLVKGADGGVLVVTTGDALYAGTEDPDDIVLLAATLRPAPGFPVAEWALRAASGGFLEGWAVANNRLFRVTASALDRWKSSEVPVTGRDPLSVWFSGGTAQLGTASGEVLLLPSRVPVVPPLLDGVISMTGLCGAIFATTTEGVWEVVPSPTASGLGVWRAVSTPVLYRPLLQRRDGHVFVVDEAGVVLELPVSCS